MSPRVVGSPRQADALRKDVRIVKPSVGLVSSACHTWHVRVFLLSPANVSGERARFLFNPRATFDLAVRLRDHGAPLGEVMTFLSGLYFRGKLTYALAFAQPPRRTQGVLVITAGDGLRPATDVVTLADLERWGGVDIDARNRRYTEPLARDARRLARSLGKAGEAVLLGSVATSKYVDPLREALGPRLRVPLEFAGRGDMSRGGLMLRCADARVELTCVPLEAAPRHGPRPPKLPPRGTGS